MSTVQRLLVKTWDDTDHLHSELTPRVLRKEVERLMSLEEGVLDAKEYKTIVKTAADAAMVRRSVDHAEGFSFHSLRMN